MSHDLTNNNSNAHNPNQDVDYQKEQRSDDKQQHPGQPTRPNPSKRGVGNHQRNRGRSRNNGGQQATQRGGFKHADSSLVPTYTQGHWVKESIIMEHGILAERMAKVMEQIAKRQDRGTAINQRDNLRVFKFGLYAQQARCNHELMNFDTGTLRVPEIFMPFWSQVRPLHDSERMIQVELEMSNAIYFNEQNLYDGFVEYTDAAIQLMDKARTGKVTAQEQSVIDTLREFDFFEDDSQNATFYYTVTTDYIRRYINDELNLYFATCYGLPPVNPHKTSEIYHIAIDAQGNLLSLPSVIPTGTALALRAAFQFVQLNTIFGPHNFAQTSLNNFDDWVRSHVTLNMMNTRPTSFEG